MLIPRSHRWSSGGLARLALSVALVGAAGCGESIVEVHEQARGEWALLECDPLVPDHCGLPFPSNAYTVADESTITGRRVQLSLEMMPTHVQGVRSSPTPWNDSDGFSASGPIMAYLPGLSAEGFELSQLPTPDTIDRSLEFDAPTILIDVDTGERIPHWAELGGAPGQERVLLLRPAQRLLDGRRYVVAIRRVVDSTGELIEPSPDFWALRESRISGETHVRARRTLYNNIFNILERDNILRFDLQLAWDFTTASQSSNTRWMLAMQQTALAWAEEAGIGYRLTSVEDDWESQDVAYRIRGEIEVPLFLDRTWPGAHLVFGPDGFPSTNPDTPWAWYPFEILISTRAAEQPGPVVQFGHDFWGRHTEMEDPALLETIDEYGYVMFGVDLLGMSEDDRGTMSEVLEGGRLDQFSSIVARQHQGMLNMLLMMRLMQGAMAEDPVVGPHIDPSRAYYYGVGQGAVFGTTYMALSNDVQRGVLDASGHGMSVVMPRSADFVPFMEQLRAAYPDPRDQWLSLGLAQQLWDRIEPGGYAYTLGGESLSGTEHSVLVRAARGDHRSSVQGAQILARTMGAMRVDTGLSDVWGLPVEPGEVQGSAYVEYDFGLPAEPLDPVPQQECEDPHRQLVELWSARQQLESFLRTGRADNPCEDACSFPQVGGC